MAMQTGGGSGGFQSEINVTPLVDVVLVLLIIFMVVVPLTLRGYDMDVPGPAVTGPPPEDRQDLEQVVLAIRPADCPVLEPNSGPGLPEDCHVRLNDEVLPVAALADRVGETFDPRPKDQRVLFLAADDRLNYEGVMRIVDLAKSGAEGLRIGLVTENPAS